MKKEGMRDLSLIIGIIIIDRILKMFLIDGCFNVFCIRAVLNRGASFGILEGMTPLLIVVSMIVLVLMGHYYKRTSPKIKLALTFIAAGTLSNLIDRVMYGGVIDLFSIFNSSSFNLADISNLVGGIMLLGIILGNTKKK